MLVKPQRENEMKLFTIKHKQTGKFFAGFDKKDQPIWVVGMDSAWKNEKMMAKCQAIALVKFGAQQKPVAL